MSKRLGNAVDPFAVLDKYGVLKRQFRPFDAVELFNPFGGEVAFRGRVEDSADDQVARIGIGIEDALVNDHFPETIDGGLHYGVGCFARGGLNRFADFFNLRVGRGARGSGGQSGKAGEGTDEGFDLHDSKSKVAAPTVGTIWGKSRRPAAGIQVVQSVAEKDDRSRDTNGCN